MANEWDEYAKAWESDPSVVFFAQSAFDELNKLGSLKGIRALDLGCGTGLLTQKIALHAKDIVAIDASEAMIEELDNKMLGNVEPVVDYFSRGLVAQHPAFRKQFDMVVASSVCGFVPQLQETVSVIYSLLDAGGTFIHWDWLTESDEGDFGLSMHKAESTLTAAGFDTVEMSTPFEVETKQGTRKVLMGFARK
ncbi:SAM-dependent methyltransferase [Vibrio sp. 10N.286.49.B3]|uniref:class I SAM-dependent DNA methyltransferase n=1 Tax=Vibrio sp. 10N.286.49.B3 TaxID=1880855 RepID=UPI000C83846B|nr:class I SAM-dependent methyltransferase [Vibrio sp. 10N.286.49.B3]PMH44504.1 SAM-dependent methyltransferase [Vibrio sp. 10N.286.49.B3]